MTLTQGRRRAAVVALQALGVLEFLGLHMEADAALRRLGRRSQQRLEFPVDIAQGDVMHQEFAVDLSQPFENDCAGGEFLTHAQERPDDEED